MQSCLKLNQQPIKGPFQPVPYGETGSSFILIRRPTLRSKMGSGRSRAHAWPAQHGEVHGWAGIWPLRLSPFSDPPGKRLHASGTKSSICSGPVSLSAESTSQGCCCCQAKRGGTLGSLEERERQTYLFPHIRFGGGGRGREPL